MTTLIDAVYRSLERAEPQARAACLSRLTASGEKYLPTASSVTLGAVLSEAEIKGILYSIGKSAIGKWIAVRLAASVAVDLDQAWVRRQYAPGRRPKWHAPHAWHQDGALGFDFQTDLPDRAASAELLCMITVWIALNPCGRSAPGLELVNQPLEHLLRPPQLNDLAVRAAFASEDFVAPVLEPGDAVLFQGNILHRTYTTPDMMQDRTSIELRCFPGHRLPARLAQDRFWVIELPHDDP